MTRWKIEDSHLREKERQEDKVFISETWCTMRFGADQKGEKRAKKEAGNGDK